MNGWGGARPGAGRKKGWSKGFSEKRPRRQLVAFDGEWDLIKKFADEVKRGDKQKCSDFIKSLN